MDERGVPSGPCGPKKRKIEEKLLSCTHPPCRSWPEPPCGFWSPVPGEQPQEASLEEKSLLSNYKLFDNMSPQAQAQDDMAYHHSLSNGIAYQQTAMKTYSNIPTDWC